MFYQIESFYDIATKLLNTYHSSYSLVGDHDKIKNVCRELVYGTGGSSEKIWSKPLTLLIIKIIDGQPIVYKSKLVLDKEHSLRRCNMIINSMALSSVCIVDEIGRIVGIITRKDVLYKNMKEKLKNIN
ncbi:hypothetical protein A3Q56_07265 [Intoshia linei]|uniref:CBS domain-containing protein n=1 Tax=Intoshia linei TaxID=1819745 RepID=A0A177ASP0_9BILA|nr:hypothetical protein A3Q56_07265 [Intoshia linei]